MTISQKQNLLQYLGYYSGNIDGIWGAMSTAATAAFQGDNGLKQTGVFDEKTEEVIKTAVFMGKFANSAKAEDPEVKDDDPVDWWDEIQFFDRSEFKCKCGGKYCDGYPAEPNETLIRVADRIRGDLGGAAIVTSGVRCKTHNANVGGASKSRHMDGKAMDFRVEGKTADQVLAEIGEYPEIRYAYAIDSYHVHMDVY